MGASAIIERQIDALDRALAKAIRAGLDQETIGQAEAGLRTLLWVSRNAEKIKLARVIDNDVVQQVLAEFPGAKVTAVSKWKERTDEETNLEDSEEDRPESLLRGDEDD